ncbi:rhamnan synthesis F family protein [Gloeomargarita sp.]
MILKMLKSTARRVKRVFKKLGLYLEVEFSPDSAIVTKKIYRDHGYHACLLFCHFHPDGVIYDYTKRLCLFFENLGVNVVFVSCYLTSESEEWLSQNVSSLIVRKNMGRDFGAWKDGIAFLKENNLYDTCSELYLINDSVFCIIPYLDEVYFQKNFIQDKDTDFIGLTESFQISYHIQSYCLKFNKKVIKSSEFQDFWNEFPLVNQKSHIIEEGEIKLSRVLINAGFTHKAIYGFEYLLSINTLANLFGILYELQLSSSIVSKKINEYILDELFLFELTQVNPTHRYWLLLLTAKCPFIKRDLIRSNPERLFSTKLLVPVIQHFLKDGEQEIKSILDCLRLEFIPKSNG